MPTARIMPVLAGLLCTLVTVGAEGATAGVDDGTDRDLLADNLPAGSPVDPSSTPPADDDTGSPAMGHAMMAGRQYDISDVRIRAGFLPYHATANGNGFTWDHNLSVGLLYVQAPRPLSAAGGFIWGAEVSFNNGSRSDNGSHISYYGGMADIMAGWAYRLPNLPNLHFEGTPFVGIGADHFNSDQDGKPSSFAYEYGLRVAGYWTFATSWQAGLDLRLMENRARPTFDGPDGGEDLVTKGLAVLFTGGKRF